MDDIYARYRETLKLGHQEAAEGRLKEALAYYHAAAQLAPERALPHTASGGMLLRLGRARESLVAYERALELEPDDLDALGGRAAALLAAGRRAEAGAVQQRIVALRDVGHFTASPAPVGEQTPMSNAETLAIAGEQARVTGNTDAATDAWLAESAEHVRAGHFDAALDACVRALALDSSSTRIHVELARIYFERGWHELGRERVALLRRLLELEPDAATSTAIDQLSERYIPPPPPAHG